VEDLKMEIERAWRTVKVVLRMVMAVKGLFARETQIDNLKRAEDTLFSCGRVGGCAELCGSS